MTALIACSHGTDSAEGRATVTRLVGLVRDRMPGVHVVPAYVDVQSPNVAAAVARESRHGEVVVVPLLLSTGHHTSVDIAAAVAAHPGARQAEPLGAHNLLGLIPASVTVGFASGAGPRVADAVAASRRQGAKRVIAASHMLAPGFFSGLVRHAGADIASSPLGADPRVAEVIIDRYLAA